MNLQTKHNFFRNNFEIITEESDFPQVSCYACSVCNKCVARNDILRQNGQNYCWECFEGAFSQKCVFCQKLIAGSNEMNFVYYDNRVWHEKCFSLKGL